MRSESRQLRHKEEEEEEEDARVSSLRSRQKCPAADLELSTLQLSLLFSETGNSRPKTLLCCLSSIVCGESERATLQLLLLPSSVTFGLDETRRGAAVLFALVSSGGPKDTAEKRPLLRKKSCHRRIHLQLRGHRLLRTSS